MQLGRTSRRTRLYSLALVLVLTSSAPALYAQQGTQGLKSVDVGTSAELVSALAEPTVSSILIRPGVPELLLENTT